VPPYADHGALLIRRSGGRHWLGLPSDHWQVMTTSRVLEDRDDTWVVRSEVPGATQMVSEEGNLLYLRTVSSRSMCLRTIAQSILSIVASHHKASLLVLGNPLRTMQL
jgi:hypothetical protein